MSSDTSKKTTHFGYREVATEQKAQLVADVFHSVAPKYDLMNDLMSLGLHRLWKHLAIAQANLRPGHRVLDVASGTGDLAKSFASIVGPTGKVLMTDINAAMLEAGREQLENQSFLGNIDYVLADAEHLPFADNHFDCVAIAFGLRNVTDKTAALRSMYHVLKPGGTVLILEFSRPQSSLMNKLYDWYSFKIIPTLGEYVAKDRASYQYLVESIRLHPDQEALKAMMLEAGFEEVNYCNLSGGIVALHKGYKY